MNIGNTHKPTKVIFRRQEKEYQANIRHEATSTIPALAAPPLYSARSSWPFKASPLQGENDPESVSKALAAQPKP